MLLLLRRMLGAPAVPQTVRGETAPRRISGQASPCHGRSRICPEARARPRSEGQVLALGLLCLRTASLPSCKPRTVLLAVLSLPCMATGIGSASKRSLQDRRPVVTVSGMHTEQREQAAAMLKSLGVGFSSSILSHK